MSESFQTILLPSRFEDADRDCLVALIADMLERLIVHNDKIPLSPESLTRFHSRSPPAITVLEYLRRIVKYTNVERTCLLITLHYIDQLCARITRFTISSLTVHRFLISSITVSSKALCDVYCPNSHYAKVGGLKFVELNLLEKELLAAIDWRLTCTRELLQEYYVNLVRTHSSGNYKLEDAEPTHISPISHYSHSRSRSTTPAHHKNGTNKNGMTPDHIMEVQNVEVVQSLVIAEPSSVLMGKTVSPPSSPPAQTGPSAFEQTMAFAALQATSPTNPTPTLVGVSDDSLMPAVRPEKRTGDHLSEQTDTGEMRPVKRKASFFP
ncbi:cyclin-domain-containing protein [Hysterangium stoloniferum]|nr:cyclin-domain-containing protein [Hysterangium stoloniferum]